MKVVLCTDKTVILPADVDIAINITANRVVNYTSHTNPYVKMPTHEVIEEINKHSDVKVTGEFYMFLKSWIDEVCVMCDNLGDAHAAYLQITKEKLKSQFDLLIFRESLRNPLNI